CRTIEDSGTLKQVLSVTKPEADSTDYIFNGPRPIQSDGTQRIPNSPFLNALYDSEDEIEFGNVIGPVADEWHLSLAGNPLATVMGIVDEETGICLIRWQVVREPLNGYLLEDLPA